MTSTRPDLAHDDLERPAGHSAAGRVVPDWHNPELQGCGSLWSTIEDLLVYVRANIHPDRTSLPDAIRLTHAPRGPAGKNRLVGLGWLISPTDTGHVHWHNGGTSGFGSFIGFNSESKIGVAVLVSRAHSEELDQAAMAVLADLRHLADQPAAP